MNSIIFEYCLWGSLLLGELAIVCIIIMMAGMTIKEIICNLKK